MVMMAAFEPMRSRRVCLDSRLTTDRASLLHNSIQVNKLSSTKTLTPYEYYDGP